MWNDLDCAELLHELSTTVPRDVHERLINFFQQSDRVVQIHEERRLLLDSLVHRRDAQLPEIEQRGHYMVVCREALAEKERHVKDLRTIVAVRERLRFELAQVQELAAQSLAAREEERQLELQRLQSK